MPGSEEDIDAFGENDENTNLSGTEIVVSINETKEVVATRVTDLVKRLRHLTTVE